MAATVSWSSGIEPKSSVWPGSARVASITAGTQVEGTSNSTASLSLRLS
jgi:hypothetical protein